MSSLSKLYSIKTTPEDFVVEEVISTLPKGKRYILIRLIKKNFNTIETIELISKKYKIKEKQIGFCGLKDKRAITTQYLTLPSFLKNHFNHKIIYGNEEKYIKLEYLDEVDERLCSDFLLKNLFRIRIYLNKKITLEKKIKSFIENYFDNQRFSHYNISVGKSIIKKEFIRAADILSKDHNIIKKYLKNNKNDYIGALRTIQSRLLTLLIHSYQSYLWNELLKNFVKRDEYKTFENFYFCIKKPKIKYKSLPLVGFDFEQKNYPHEIKKIYDHLLKIDGVTYRDFVIKQLPKLSVNSNSRQSYNYAEIDITTKGNIINLEFSLPKGSYATIVVKKIMMMITNNFIP